jgi:hypothetical protein
VSDSATLSSARLRILNHEYRLSMESRLQRLLHERPDWRCRPKRYVQLGICKHDLACKALSERQAIAKIADRLELPVGTVRRLAGTLDGERFFKGGLAAIVSGWCYRDFLRPNGRSKVINQELLAGVLGPDRLEILVQYTGLRCDQLLGRLSGQLSAYYAKLCKRPRVRGKPSTLASLRSTHKRSDTPSPTR